MIDTIAAFDGRLAKVEGAERSGKTQALVARCAHLIQNGEAPASILVAVTNNFAAQAFRKRLRRALPANLVGAALSVRVSTALDAAVSVLDEPAAREATGRVPRILNSAEYNFFLEDLKTIGEHPRKLRNMLGFLDRKMAGYEPREEWNAGTAADNLLAYATRILKLRGAMLAGEVPMMAADFLKSDAGEGARGSFAYVLADDFQNFSHAEQTVLCLLADKQIMVTGNPNQMMSKRGNHPYVEGFLKFEAVRRDVEVFHLQGAFGNPQVIALADALCTEGDMDSAYIAGTVTPIERAAGAEGLPQGVQSIKWNTPEDELNGLTKYLRKLMDGQEDAREALTCVVVPNLQRVRRRRCRHACGRPARLHALPRACGVHEAGPAGRPHRHDRLAQLVRLRQRADELRRLDGPAGLRRGRGSHALPGASADRQRRFRREGAVPARPHAGREMALRPGLP